MEHFETLLVIVFAPALLKERLMRRDSLAALVGFVGVLVVVRPET